jgi:hypothetical protein
MLLKTSGILITVQTIFHFLILVLKPKATQIFLFEIFQVFLRKDIFFMFKKDHFLQGIAQTTGNSNMLGFLSFLVGVLR